MGYPFATVSLFSCLVVGCRHLAMFELRCHLAYSIQGSWFERCFCSIPSQVSMIYLFVSCLLGESGMFFVMAAIPNVYAARHRATDAGTTCILLIVCLSGRAVAWLSVGVKCRPLHIHVCILTILSVWANPWLLFLRLSSPRRCMALSVNASSQKLCFFLYPSSRRLSGFTPSCVQPPSASALVARGPLHCPCFVTLALAPFFHSGHFGPALHVFVKYSSF